MGGDYHGFVPQHVFLLESTLAEDIAFDVPPDHIAPNRPAGVFCRVTAVSAVRTNSTSVLSINIWAAMPHPQCYPLINRCHKDAIVGTQH